VGWESLDCAKARSHHFVSRTAEEADLADCGQ